MGQLSLPIDFEAYKKREYGKDLSWDILKDYQREDDFITFHEDDKDLETITIYLPTSPDWRKIDGWGLKAEDQKFEVPKLPKRIAEKELANKIGDWKESQSYNLKDDPVTLDDMHDYMVINQKEYRKEIAFIKLMWYYRLYGYWCFINGKPTFIDGYHFYYLCFNEIDIGLPHYRDRDRRIHIAIRYFWESTEAIFKYRLTYLYGEELKVKYFNNIDELEQFKKLEEDQAAKKKLTVSSYSMVEGDYVIDMGYRTTLGLNYPKHRREGATYKADSIGIEVSTRNIKTKAGILSMTGDHALKAFKFHVMAPFRQLIWFFKPNYEGSDDSKTALSLKPSAKKIGSKGTHVVSATGLESFFNFSKTSGGGFYDSQKLIYLHEDECGKTEEQDVYARHDQTKHCLMQGSGAEMIGFTFKTSTVGEMTKKGGEKFHKLCEASHNEDRNQMGFTQTKLVTIFIPAYDGLEKYIDAYGASVINEPTPQQREFIGRDYGAKRHLEIEEQQIRQRKDRDALSDLNEHLRLHPKQYRDCFRRNTSDIGFNIAILTDRTNELRFMKDATEAGTFKYNTSSNRVEWHRDRTGDFRLSLNLPDHLSNNFHKDANGLWTPGNGNKFIAGSDPFRFLRTEGHKMSNGGGAVFWNRDYNLDPQTKPSDEWQSHRFVCDYIGRPDTKIEYCENMLNMCLYFGCKMSPEINVDDVWRYFEESGFGNFLFYFDDPSTGQPRKTPGYNALTGSKNDIFNEIRDYVELHGMRDRHIRILEQVEQINGIEEMTKYDLFATAGGCLISSIAMNPPSSDSLKNKASDGDQERGVIEIGNLIL